MEEISRENALLLQQVRDLQRQLALVNRNHIEFSLAPPQKISNHDWKEDPNWSFEERKKILESLSFSPYFFDHEEHKLLQLSYDMFVNLGLVEKFSNSKEKITKFLDGSS